MSPILGFVIATVVFMASFYYVVETAVQTQGDTSGSDESNYGTVARSVADVMFARGTGWYSSGACVAEVEQTVDGDHLADASARFGLGAEACDAGMETDLGANRLAFSKIKNVYSGMMGSTDNNYADYEDALDSLQLEEQQLNFHIRSWPVLASVRQTLGQGHQDPNIKPLYIGHYEEGVGATRPTITASGSWAAAADDSVELKVTIDNGPGSFDERFSVLFSIKTKKNIDFSLHTLDVANEASVDVTHIVPRTKDWEWASSSSKIVSYQVSDPVGPLASGEIDLTSANMGTTTPSNTARTVVAFEMDKGLFVDPPFGGSNKFPDATYTGFDGKGNKIASFDGNDVNIQLTGLSIAYSSNYAAPSSGGEHLDDDAALGAGTYKVELRRDSDDAVIATDRIEILGSVDGCNSIDPGDYVPADSVLSESWMADILFLHYQRAQALSKFDAPALPTAAGGDVFPDVKCALDNDLAAFLTDVDGNPTVETYTTVIVGSNVDHNSMTSAAAKQMVKDWVEAGGTLIVLGSDQQAVQWLQPIFQASIGSGSTGVSTPDSQHPVLNVPNDLDYESFNNFGTSWDYTGPETKDRFSHVVSPSGVTDGSQDILAVSNPGQFGLGKVILTSWRPYELTSDTSTECPPYPDLPDPDSNCQSLFLMHNLVTLSYRELYLDFGPPIPVGAGTGAHTRLASVYHPDLEQHLAITIRIFVFPGTGG